MRLSTLCCAGGFLHPYQIHGGIVYASCWRLGGKGPSILKEERKGRKSWERKGRLREKEREGKRQIWGLFHLNAMQQFFHQAAISYLCSCGACTDRRRLLFGFRTTPSPCSPPLLTREREREQWVSVDRSPLDHLPLALYYHCYFLFVPWPHSFLFLLPSLACLSLSFLFPSLSLFFSMPLASLNPYHISSFSS